VVKAKGQRQRHQDKDKASKRKKGSPRQGAPYFTRLVGRSSRNSKASESGCYCTRFTCICFLCCTFFFEAFYIYLLQTGFPMGVFFRGHVDQKSISILCMLRSVDQHFKVKDIEVVLCVLMYIACANIG
jgi:hypothetical protein